MINLVLNENMKIFRRARTWIMIGMLMAIVTAAFAINHRLAQKPEADWRSAVEKELRNAERIAADGAPEERRMAEERMRIAQYRLKYDIPPPHGERCGTGCACPPI